MVKVTKTTGGASIARTGVAGRKSAASETFTIGAARSAPASGVGDATPTVGLDVLIALQSDGRKKDRRHAATRALSMLERVRDGMLGGRIMVQDLEALRDAADAKEPSGDPVLDSIYDDIALRARVELAKLGRD